MITFINKATLSNKLKNFLLIFILNTSLSALYAGEQSDAIEIDFYELVHQHQTTTPINVLIPRPIYIAPSTHFILNLNGLGSERNLYNQLLNFILSLNSSIGPEYNTAITNTSTQGDHDRFRLEFRSRSSDEDEYHQITAFEINLFGENLISPGQYAQVIVEGNRLQGDSLLFCHIFRPIRNQFFGPLNTNQALNPQNSLVLQ